MQARIRRIRRIPGKVYFMPNPVVIDPVNAITDMSADSLWRKSYATYEYLYPLSFGCGREN